MDDPRAPEEDGEEPEEVRREPARYAEIPRLTHGEHHEIFRAYLDTLPLAVQGMCNNASIGGFLRDLRRYFKDRADEYEQGWYDFHDEALRDRATEWLAERGFEVTWE